MPKHKSPKALKALKPEPAAMPADPDEAFLYCYKAQGDWLLKAGEIAYQQSKADPEWIGKMCKKHPELDESTLSVFISIGAGDLHIGTLYSDSPGMRALRGLPYSLQERYLTEPIAVLDINEPDKPIMVKAADMDRNYVSQVFTQNGVRSLEAQRKWIESQRVKFARSELPSGAEAYEIKGDVLIVLKPSQYHRKLVAKILRAMDAAAASGVVEREANIVTA